jgi:hypothetical protein
MVLADAELTEPERRLVLAASIGELVDLRAGDVDLDDPSQGGRWDAARTVRADLLAELLTGRRQSGTGPVRAVKLGGARITGVLDLEAARLACPLLLDGCSVDQPVNLKEAWAGAIRLPGSHVPGISADQLHTEGNLELNSGFTASAEIGLSGAHIGGRLDLSAATVTSPSGPAVDADGLTVEQSMSADGFTAHGEVRLSGAHIGGRLGLDNARLDGAGGPALGADGLTVRLSMFCRDGFTAHGEVRLRTAQIGGQLNFIGASLTSPGGRALAALGLTVGQDMFCHRLSAEGEIRMTGARIGGQLDFSGASLTNPGGYALAARGLTVGQDIYFTDGFTAGGQVQLRGARIGGRLDFAGASLADPGGQAVSLEGVSAAALCLLPRTPPDGVVDLTNARAGSFYDDQATWPAAMRLRGFAYDKLENDAVSVTDRLAWLGRSEGGYIPGLYDQLAGAYRRAGRVAAARRTGVAKDLGRRSELTWPGKAWNSLLYVTVGYGYRNWLAGVWLGVLLVLGSLVFASAYPSHMHRAAPVVPAFQPVIYALDVLLPIVNLGQRQAWVPQGLALACSWLLTGAGWVLTTAVVAGLTNALKRD